MFLGSITRVIGTPRERTVASVAMARGPQALQVLLRPFAGEDSHEGHDGEP
jgi:hypothetical protein